MTESKMRLTNYLKFKGVTKKEFCSETGISYANMTGKSLESELGGEQISSIFMKFPDLNPDWLLLGKGEMLRSEAAKAAPSDPSLVAYLEEKLQKKEQELAAAHEAIGRLRQQVAHLGEKVESLSARTREVSI